MNVLAIFLGVAYLLGCLFVAFLGLLNMGFGENRTPEEQAEADQLGWLMLTVLPLAIAVVILLGLHRALLAGIAFVAQVVVGFVALVGWMESGGGVGPILVALAVAGAGLGTLLAATSERARDRDFA